MGCAAIVLSAACAMGLPARAPAADANAVLGAVYGWEDLLAANLDQKDAIRAALAALIARDGGLTRGAGAAALLPALTPRQQCVYLALCDQPQPPNALAPDMHPFVVIEPERGSLRHRDYRLAVQPGRRIVLATFRPTSKVDIEGGALRQVGRIRSAPNRQPNHAGGAETYYFAVLEAARPGMATARTAHEADAIMRHPAVAARISVRVWGKDDKPVYVRVFGPGEVYVGDDRAATPEELARLAAPFADADRACPVVIRPADWMPDDAGWRHMPAVWQALSAAGLKDLSVDPPTIPAGPAAAAPSRWGPASDGVRLQVALDRAEACAGEQVTLTAALFNATAQPMNLPRLAGTVWAPGELEVTDPNGRRYTFVSSRFDYEPAPTEPGRPAWYARWLQMRLTADAVGWRAAEEANAPPPSFRRAGTYTFRVRIAAKAGWCRRPGGAAEWVGQTTAETARLVVRDWPADRRRKVLTAGQEADLAAYLAAAGLSAAHPIGDRIGSALMQADNEALAGRIVGILRDRRPQAGKPLAARSNLFYFVQQRACARGPYGPAPLCIDGPCLGPLAELCLDILDWELSRRAAQPRGYSVDGLLPLLPYVKARPDQTALRTRAEALARKYAKVADQPSATNADQHQAHRRLGVAWALLRGLDVLRPGMTLNQATAILGQPTGRRGGTVEWYYSSPMHVNPCLRAEVRDGQVVSFRTDRY